MNLTRFNSFFLKEYHIITDIDLFYVVATTRHKVQ